MSYFDTHSDSPFASAYNGWRHGGALLSEYAAVDLDEYRSVASYLLGIPAYADDAELIAFAAALDSALYA